MFPAWPQQPLCTAFCVFLKLFCWQERAFASRVLQGIQEEQPAGFCPDTYLLQCVEVLSFFLTIRLNDHIVTFSFVKIFGSDLGFGSCSILDTRNRLAFG